MNFKAYTSSETVCSVPNFIPNTAHWNNARLQHFSLHANSHKRLAYLDPCLPSALAALAPGATIESMPSLIDESKSLLICFDDCWSFFSWAKWWSQLNSKDTERPIVVLHADDHADLDPPYLILDQYRIIDAFTGWPVSMDTPESIASSILSGAIGIGSFFVPLLHRVPNIEIRHLVPGHRSIGSKRLSPNYETTHLGLPKMQRLSLTESEDGAAVYIRTTEPARWVQNLPENAHVLLHIDLDYFNNRYAGDENWQHSTPLHDPQPVTMSLLLHNLCQVLDLSAPRARIDHCAIALSPGFCPSEHWLFLLDRLRSGLEPASIVLPKI